jgi:hypothetical protein
MGRPGTYGASHREGECIGRSIKPTANMCMIFGAWEAMILAGPAMQSTLEPWRYDLVNTGREVSKTDISQFTTGISQFKTGISQFKTDSSLFKTDNSLFRCSTSSCCRLHSFSTCRSGILQGGIWVMCLDAPIYIWGVQCKYGVSYRGGCG